MRAVARLAPGATRAARLAGPAALPAAPGRRWTHPGEYDVTDRDSSLTNIQSWDEYGFRVNNIYMRGSVVCLPKFTLLWDVQHISDVSPESLSPILMMREPQIQLLLIGTGSKMRNVNPALFGWFSRRGVAVEHMRTKHALSTFNVLNREGRGVAAAMLSRRPVSREEACYYKTAAALPGFADGMSAAATAASVVEPDDAMLQAATGGGVLVDVDQGRASRASAMRRSPKGTAASGGLDGAEDDEDDEDDDPYATGYSPEARWERIFRGMEELTPNLPNLVARRETTMAEIEGREPKLPPLPPKIAARREQRRLAAAQHADADGAGSGGEAGADAAVAGADADGAGSGGEAASDAVGNGAEAASRLVGADDAAAVTAGRSAGFRGLDSLAPLASATAAEAGDIGSAEPLAPGHSRSEEAAAGETAGEGAPGSADDAAEPEAAAGGGAATEGDGASALSDGPGKAGGDGGQPRGMA